MLAEFGGMDIRSVAICDEAGVLIASGRIGHAHGSRCELMVETGAPALRAAYFLKSARNVWCVVGGTVCRARLSTRWHNNRRTWALCFTDVEVEELVRAPAKPAASTVAA
jgi:hypothetical protein